MFKEKYKNETRNGNTPHREPPLGGRGSCYETDMLVDYGASTSVISKSVIDKIENRMGTMLPRTHTDVHIRSYGGHSVPSEGTVITTLEIGGRTFNTPFTITPYETATKVILGTTLLVKARIGLSWQQDDVYLTIGGENNKRLAEAHLNLSLIHI